MKQRILCLLGASALAFGCQQTDDPDFSYYEERVGPVLTNGCSRGPAGSGCHVARDDGTSLGNLDVSSFDALMRRDDVLQPYGPYSSALLLLKAGDQIDVRVETFDETERFVSVTTDIRHNNGQTIDIGSSAYSQLRQWIEAGHTRTGVQDESLAVNLGECLPEAGSHPLYDRGLAERFPAHFDRFVRQVEPLLRETCAGGDCHGSPIADLYLGCGDDGGAQSQWNFWVAVQHLSTPASTSGLLRRPLSTFRGGVFHEGGNIFASAEDPAYVTIRDWADALVEESPEAIAPPDGVTEGLRYFANRVQPMMVRKGCMFLNCHSPSMFHDLRLQGGAQGHFSRVATYRNWDSARLLLALDASNPNESRIIAKNLYPPEQVAGMPGIFHRGGSLFEDFGMAGGGAPNGATPDDCAGVDADAGDLNEIPAYCVMLRWWEIERQEAIAAGEIFPDTEIVRSVAWISRPTGVGEPRDFDTYRPGADLVLAPATVDTATNELSLGAETSLLGGCGLDPSTADLRGTAVSWDGSRIAFGARSSGSAPLRLYWMNDDGSGCEPIPGLAPAMDSQHGILTHDFDPAFAPDGRIVFASARGNLDADILGQDGPTRTPAAMQPNANLYVYDPSDSSVRQLTFLLNQELMPSFMTDGRVIFTTEKREPDFHQLAGRRQNLDGGDYHPLFAQRGSVGYRSATEIVELLDRNLAVVAAPLDAADGAGEIVLVNRSIGPDQDDRDPGDRFYIASQRFLTAGGAYRSPAGLPTGRLLVSCDRGAGDLTSGGYAYRLCELDPDTGSLREIGGAAGRANISAVPIFARADREIFHSRIDEANGNTMVVPGDATAEVEVLDFPLLDTLLFQNTREDREIDFRVGGFDVYAEYPPPAGTAGFGDASGGDVVSDDFGMMYLRRERLGHIDLNVDGSARFAFRGGLPIVLGVTDSEGNTLMFEEGDPFTGERIQREQMQFYPGERSHQSFRRELFNGMCGGCHGSISGRELDVAVDVDVLTHASRAMTEGQGPAGL